MWATLNTVFGSKSSVFKTIKVTDDPLLLSIPYNLWMSSIILIYLKIN